MRPAGGQDTEHSRRLHGCRVDHRGVARVARGAEINRGRRSPYVCPPRFRGKFKLSTYQAFLVAIYFILAGAITISVEMKDWPFVERWVPFLYTFWGRGGWYRRRGGARDQSRGQAKEARGGDAVLTVRKSTFHGRAVAEK